MSHNGPRQSIKQNLYSISAPTIRIEWHATNKERRANVDRVSEWEDVIIWKHTLWCIIMHTHNSVRWLYGKTKKNYNNRHQRKYQSLWQCRPQFFFLHSIVWSIAVQNDSKWKLKCKTLSERNKQNCDGVSIVSSLLYMSNAYDYLYC